MRSSSSSLSAHCSGNPAATAVYFIVNSLLIDDWRVAKVIKTKNQLGSAIGVGFEPPFLDKDKVDEVRAIDQELAFEMCRRLASHAGIFGGGSTGLNVVAAIELARELGPGNRVVILGCDNGSKYLGGHIYS